mgnify:FL=1
MHKYTLLTSNATKFPKKNFGGNKNMATQKIKLTWENNTIFHCIDIFISFPCQFPSLPNQLLDQPRKYPSAGISLDQQYHFIECMWRLSGDGCLVNFCTYKYYPVPKKSPNKYISNLAVMGLSSTLMIKNSRLLTTFGQSRMSKTIRPNCPAHPSTGFWTIIVWLGLGF